MNPIAIIGGGGWGTALAITLARIERDVRLWVYEPYLVETMIATHENPLYRARQQPRGRGSRGCSHRDSRRSFTRIPAGFFEHAAAAERRNVFC